MTNKQMKILSEHFQAASEEILEIVRDGKNPADKNNLLIVGMVMASMKNVFQYASQNPKWGEK